MAAILKTMCTLGAAFVLATTVACQDDDSNDGTDMGGSAGAGAGAGVGGSSTTGGAPSGTGGGGGDVTAPASILEIAADNPDLSLLVDAVTKAGLAEALAGDPLTVFAPTNDAFVDLLEALGLASLDDLSAEQLKPILLYHVVGARVDAAAATTIAEGDGVAESLGGKFVLALDGDALTVDNATVIEADIEASNGIVHVIDAVLLPSITDIVTTDASLSGLKTLVLAADGDGGTPAIATALDAASTPGAWTLFAPNNSAVEAVTSPPSGQDLTNVLLYHAIANAEPVYAAAALALDNASVETAFAGHDVVVNGGTGVTITDETDATATVTVADLYAENGVIHVIDAVLLPD